MDEKNSEVPKSNIFLLSIYAAGIIVGGGILALPFVALDTGLILLVALLSLLAVVFCVVYSRILDAVSISVPREGSKIGLILYDHALENSDLFKWGRLAFTIGIILYVYPADIVYVLYGLKSIIQLSNYVYGVQVILSSSGLISLFLLASTFRYLKKPTPLMGLLSKLLFMTLIWVISIYAVSYVSNRSIIVIASSLGFTISLIGGEYFPDILIREKTVNNLVEEEYEIHPRHKAQAVLTIFKLTLVTTIPIMAFSMIAMASKLPSLPPLFPRSLVSLIDSFSVIVFMYVGSGVYNILMYKWIVDKIDKGKKISNYGVLISLIVYLIFSLIILVSVDSSILETSNINREHAFISLSRKLEQIGLSALALLVIALAALFALVSVSVAYIGFTDTLSERLELDLGYNRDKSWLLITIIAFTSTTLLELFNVSKIATDALGVAGNAGGGLFLLVLPWLMKTKKDDGKPMIATFFLILVLVVNLFMMIGATTIVALVASVISTILVIIFGAFSILEWRKNHKN